MATLTNSATDAPIPIIHGMLPARRLVGSSAAGANALMYDVYTSICAPLPIIHASIGRKTSSETLIRMGIPQTLPIV